MPKYRVTFYNSNNKNPFGTQEVKAANQLDAVMRASGQWLYDIHRQSGDLDGYFHQPHVSVDSVIRLDERIMPQIVIEEVILYKRS